MSLTFVVEELGVPALLFAGERESPCNVVEDDNGDAVPEFSFFFDALFESLARDRDSCCDGPR